MKVRKTGGSEGLPEKIEIPMTPMIDMVFQLLVFFIMNFRVADQEGDFNVKMPLAGAPTAPSDVLASDMQLVLSADAEGNLSGIDLDGKTFTSLREVRDEIVGRIGLDRGPAANDAQVELDCAPNLKYSYTVDAITAVSGFVNERGEVVKLVEIIKFKPPKDAQ